MYVNPTVDGIKKDGIQLPHEPSEEPKKETVKEEAKQKELLQSKPVQRERNRTKKNLDGSYGKHFLRNHSMTKRGG